MIPMLIGAGLTLGGSILSGMGAQQSYGFQAGLSEFNARQYWTDSKIALMNADEQARAIRKQGRAITGAQRTRYAKAGVRMQGTPLEVMADTIEKVELDAINTRLKGKFASKQLKTQAIFARQQAGAYRSAGDMAMFSSILGGATGAMGFFDF
jgi:hypothetical protein